MFAYPRHDVVAGLVVFLVALPLCLGIAVASGVPPLSGLVAGVIGGLVIPLISRSPLSVSGPAAGLASIVLAEVAEMGLGRLLTAVVLAGLLQIGFGAVRAGRFSTLVPSAVIKGMLAAIGATIVLKQIPTALGVKSLGDVVHGFHPGAAAVAVASLAVLYGWRALPLGRLRLLPGALVAVVLGTAMGEAFEHVPFLRLAEHHRVSVPEGGFSGLLAALPRPELGGLVDEDVWLAAVTIAIVASLETLLSLQAVDRLDPLHRKSPPDRELLAQGLGNVLSGLLGGLPMTAVIVRSGANVAAGGRERLSAVVHAVLLLLAVIGLAPLLNRIPLPCLAAVLVQVGLGLCRPSLFREQYRLGFDQFAPFAITVAAILYEDLLVGVCIGVVVGVLFVLRQNASGAVVTEIESAGVRVRLRRDGTFVTKPSLQAALDQVPDGGQVTVDATGEYVDHDVKELLATFAKDAERRRIRMELRGVDLAGVAGGGGH